MPTGMIVIRNVVGIVTILHFIGAALNANSTDGKVLPGAGR